MYHSISINTQKEELPKQISMRHLITLNYVTDLSDTNIIEMI